MNTKKLLMMILLIGMLAACQVPPEVAPTLDPNAPETTPPPAATTPAEALPTEMPAGAPTGAPSAAPVESPPPAASETPFAPVTSTGFCERVDPTLIELDMQGLMYEWQADCVAEVPFTQDGPVFTGIPEHVQINFNGRNPNTRQSFEPVLYIIPAQAYADMWAVAGHPVAGQQLDALRALVGRRPAGVPTNNVPVLPLVEAQATNDLAVQGRHLDFETWDGIRFVGRFAQGPAPVTNEGLRYIFQGFAGEGDEVFVAFFYPVSSTQLPATIEEVTSEDMASFEGDPAGFINLVAVELNGLTNVDWRPGLDLLDDIVASLQYGGSETGEEAPPVGGGADQTGPFGIVSAAAGVNIRSGPSTAFPIIGNASFGTGLELTGRSANNQWFTTPAQGASNTNGWVSAPLLDAFNTASLPVVAAPPPPATPTPAPPPAVPRVAFWADRTTINQGECATLRWSVENIQAVWVYPQGQNFETFPVTGDGSRQVCPSQTTVYEMRVQMRDGSLTFNQVQINVNPGNTLANTNWVLSSFAGAGPVLGNPPTISFGTGNYVSGFGGCNTFWGNYSVFPGGGLAMSVGPRSMMACEADITEQEARYLSALQGTGSFELAANQLILRDSGGAETLRFLRP